MARSTLATLDGERHEQVLVRDYVPIALIVSLAPFAFTALVQLAERSGAGVSELFGGGGTAALSAFF